MMDEQQALNAPYIIEWNGKKLKFSGVTQGVKAACVAACKLRAIQEQDELVALRYPNDESGKRESNRQFEDSLRSGRYGWSHDGGGDLLSEWRQTPEGVMVFASSLLDAGGTPLSHEELQMMAIDRNAEFALILKLVLLDADGPKARRPAAAIALSGLLAKLQSPESTTCSSANSSKSQSSALAG